ncbi:hypothetical protein KDA11_07110 [Candidatus Saccharibacteria bacterium]|nr:hypothetical protein [Candidatus Saccharibacteria bacterium]
MFNNKSDNQSQSPKTDMDQVANDINESSPQIGLGTNPTTFNPVMPAQPSETPSLPSQDDNNDNGLEEDSPASQPSLTIPTANSGVNLDQLKDIKTQALNQLSPLVSQLDQSPEERYKTIMMLIQASDNHELIKEAYQAANQITDEKSKAEALLAIVNEINYFSQHHSQDQ